jgi:regulator of extracellular matrix RemA (YlzA/DUF370 family)
MSTTTSTNPVVKAIVSGSAPQPARLAAANGLLPLAQPDLLEVLVALRESDDVEIAEAATSTLASQEQQDLLAAARAADTSAAVLEFLGTIASSHDVQQAVIQNTNTPDPAIAKMAGTLVDGALLDLIAINQQRLVRMPAIIDAILENPARSVEAERRARETKREFFEKERGARQIADELRAQGKTAAAEFFESADIETGSGGMSLEDAWLLAQHIEVSDADLDDSWLPAERYEEFEPENAAEQAAAVQRVIESERRESGAEIKPERVALIRQIMNMKTKDRIKMARKGDREARSILIRDSNKVVATAVVNNPRITDHEIENIASMRTVADEVLRLIAMNRAWTRSYTVIYNLCRNPRTPIPTSMGMLPRIRTKDLQTIATNRNVSEAVRRQASRLSHTRSGE